MKSIKEVGTYSVGMGREMQIPMNEEPLVHPDAIDPAADFEGWLHKLVMDGEDSGLSIEEMHEKMVKVHEDHA